MTLEEKYHKAMLIVSCTIGTWCSEDIQNYVTSLEQRIAEVEEIANGRHDLIMELSSQLTVKMLSELESPKTCEGCKHLDHCSIVQTQYYLDTTTFYCGNYEPKKDTE